ncbi:glycosyltransferase [Clostridium botulinum]|uniref:glycosyltransferase n=2 Tax=Clostridium botulinum TaxID=1491 RepID=UPI000773EA21|nr:glycosyltransferase family 2 protein [Clostridium botulinum]MBN1057671.1 glycosyltransferase [Clostridium botulinum]MBN1060916.1 glycosyltransferase [Clostridium botulinum]NFE73494.1 glycosyltransferase [Clostridium botulinum]NFE95086.1 glycosyltransferase [Clostridium botulinum]NFH79864.1 glycosyltransferase [Clostridium botulinum]
MISLCMIVKNEECTLEKCLKRVSEFVDEIIIVDTGSTDNTNKIALKYTDKVYGFEWCDDFAKARNFSIKKASNDWILILDADEVIEKFDVEKIKKNCISSNNIVGRIKRINEYEDMYGTKKYVERVNRLFNRCYFKYEGIIHEQIVSKNKLTYETNEVDICVNHIGYSKEVVNRTNKIQRNIELLRLAIKTNSEDPYLYYQLGKSYFMKKKYEIAVVQFEKAIMLMDNFCFEYVEDLIECYGYSLVNLNMFDKSLCLYDYEKYYCNSPDFIFLLGIVEMNNGNFQKSAEIFLKCTQFKQGKTEGITTFLPLYNIGVIFECLGMYEYAIDYYRQCEEYPLAVNRINNIIG